MDRRIKHRFASQRGLTLIELLVVLLIIAMTASVVVLSAPPSAGKSRSEADRFAARVHFASEYAITSGVLIGLELTERDFNFYRYNRGLWAPLTGAGFNSGVFSENVSVSFELAETAKLNEPPEEIDNNEEAPTPNIFFSPTGETTAVTVEFHADRQRSSMTLGHAGDVEVARHDTRR